MWIFRLLAMAGLLCALGLPMPAQTDTRFDSGMNLPFNEKAGDLNPQTGALTLTETDLHLPGRAGMDFEFSRIWTSPQANVYTMYRDPVTGENRLGGQTVEARNRLGVGWSSNLPLIYDDLSAGVLTQFLVFQGCSYEIDQSGVGIRNPAKSNLLWYDLLDKRLYRDQGMGYGDCGLDAVVLAGEGVADLAGERSAHVLIMKDNSRYWFRPDGQVMVQADRTGLNRIWYFYDGQDRLCLVVDSVGRHIRFEYDEAGNLALIRWTVEAWAKDRDGRRSRQSHERSVAYAYACLDDAAAYPKSAGLKPRVVDYTRPHALLGMTDPMGHVTSYQYREAPAAFTYDDQRSHATNVNLLLVAVTRMPRPDGSFLNRREFAWEPPAKGSWRKYFYSGYMEYDKLSMQLSRDRHGRAMNETRYRYYDNGEDDNFNCYSTVVETGNVKSTYRYSLSGQKNQDNVLDTLLVQSADGFIQLTDFSYLADRTRSMEEVYRQGSLVYRELFLYDLKMNLKSHEDRMGLVTVMEYDDIYGIPIKEYKTCKVLGQSKTNRLERSITPLGQVKAETIWVTGSDGVERPLRQSLNDYDQYGNLVCQTDATGEKMRTSYDLETHAWPVKVQKGVDIASWGNGRDVHTNWQSEPVGEQRILTRSWKEYNSDGSVWLETDNEGYAVEHFYDALGAEIERVLPNGTDLLMFAATIGADADGNPLVADPLRFTDNPMLNAFLASRQDNPGVRYFIDYGQDLVKTEADIDRAKGQVKRTGVQKDGLGHTEAELEYNSDGSVYAVKTIVYDAWGRMVALTDPDAAGGSVQVMMNGTLVERHDKTWLIKNDDLGRRILIMYPEVEAGRTDLKTISYDDAENSMLTVDQDSRVSYQRSDWNGNVVTIEERGYHGETSVLRGCLFVYDQLNRKVRFIDPKGLTTEYRYDERNLLVEQIHSDTGGSDRMSYDDLGRMVRKTDRKGQVSRLAYDELGRNTGIRLYASAPDEQANKPAQRIDLAYDKRGNTVRVASNELIEHYTYDAAQRVVKLDRRVVDAGVRGQVAAVWGGNPDIQTFSFGYAYNDAGMISSMIYPDGKSHAFAYDGVHGRLRQIDQGLSGAEAPFVTGLDYNLSGQVTEMRYGNGTRQDWSFDNRKRIERIRVTGPQGTIEDLHYILSPSGNIMAINDNEYSYDGFNRISGAKTKLPETKDLGKLVAGHYGTYQVSDPSGVSNFLGDADLNHDGRINGVDQILSTYTHQDELYDIEAFAYDQNGNRTKLTQGGDEYSYVFGLRNQLASIHLKKKGQTSKALFASYEYDANGNTTKRTIYGGSKPLVTVFIYDIMNRLISTVDNGKVTKYAYDNANNRLYKQGPDGLTLYLRHGQIAVAMDIEVYAASSEDGKSMLGRVNRYVLSGDLLAGRSTMVYNLDGTTMQRLSYYHLDHLNSTKSVSDLRGQMEVQYLYRAFGEQLRRLGTGNATYTYGGKELDSLTNLYYFNARYYDATTGRFINVDPIQDGANWYVYCSNNPLGFKDPTGLIQVEIDPVTDEKNKLAASAEKASTGSPISTGKLTSAFGVYDYYKKDGTYVQKQHNGVDFAAPDGTPIKAIKDGTISGVKANIDGHGNSVEIDHGNGLKTVSSHMNAKPQWEVGDPVAKGATIGQVGNTSATGASTGPHLHFETILNGKPVDPISILGGVTKGVTPQIEKGYVKHDSSGKYQNWLLK